MAEVVQEHHACPVPPSLAAYVDGVHGYRVAGLPPGVHVGLPGTALTLVVPLDAGVVVADGPDVAAYGAMVGGLLDRPVEIRHDGSSYGVQVDLTPAGVRALFGVPASAIGAAVALDDLDGVVAGTGRRLAERASAAPTWCARVGIVLDTLTHGLDPAPSTRPEVGHAWDRIRRSAGRLPVGAVAADVGWSTRHLQQRFRAEFGLSPKTVARLSRFERARDLVGGGTPLADAAVAAGYADQAHLNRDWLAFVGRSPTRWRAEDRLAFVQDRGRAEG